MDNGLDKSGNKRIDVLDALRGFAIAAIMVIHCSNNFLYSSGRVETQPWIAKLDLYSKNLLYFLVEGKAYAIFALLFGFTFALQLEKQLKKGGDFGYRMAWRMILLMGFGLLNASLFAGGDPLIFYAIAMFFVIPIRKVKDSVILTIAIILFAQPIEIIDSISPFIKNLHYQYYEDLTPAIKEGNFWKMAIVNMSSGVKGALLWAAETGRFSQTIALFLLGMWIFRRRYVYSDTEKIKRVATLLAITCGALYIIKSIAPHTILTMNYNLSFALLIVTLFILTFRAFSKNKIFKLLQNYGKLSLSNFVMQSLIGSFIFYPWGLNLSAYIGATLSILIGISIVIIQIYISDLWVKRVGKGALEALWHRLTWI